MDKFIGKHGEVIEGVLSCFDRMLFRGYLPIMSGYAMAAFLEAKGVRRFGLKAFLLMQAARLKKHALRMASATGRPYQYLGKRTRMEDLARRIAERDRVEEGLICVFAVLEPSRTFSVVWKEQTPFIQSARRKCLHLYYFFIDRHLGLIHVKLQTWFPFQIQVYLNGHEWLARKLDRHGVKYLKVDNAFAHLSDVERAQRISDQFPSVDWVRMLGRYALRVNPLLGGLLQPMQYYWVTAQAEYSTDILFRRCCDLQDLMPRLLEYSTLYFGAKDVMSFLGRKLVGQFRGEVVTDHFAHDLAGKRLPGRRVKHRAKFNWIKMYDKAGTVLRVETVINQPEEFRVRRRMRRNGKWTNLWGPMRKGIAFLFRYQQVSAQSNARYLDALACVDDPTPAIRELDALTRAATTHNGRKVRPFNPLCREDRTLFEVLLAGEHALHGFTNRDLRAKLARTPFPLAAESEKQPGQITRLLRRLHAHGLIAKIPRSRRWRVSFGGRRLMASAIKLREVAFPRLFAEAA
jgi:hypothetical protein